MSPPAHRPAVEIADLAKSYGTADVLQGVSFAVAAGQILGLLGRNGAGKTTTLECILGLRRPDRGRVLLGGIDARQSPLAARAILGAQLQDAALQDKITPAEALRYFASFYSGSRPVDELLADFDLRDKAHVAFDTLSGGQKQRLFVALAFVHDPAVVVLDEPTAGLDPQARRELHACLVGARKRGAAVILSTHDLDEAAQLCDRVAILHAGRIVAVGEPSALINGSRRKPRIALTTAEPMNRGHFGACDPLLLDITIDPHDARRAVMECADVERALAAVLEALMRERHRVVEIDIRRPTLEDVFFEHTGTVWTDGSARTERARPGGDETRGVAVRPPTEP